MKIALACLVALGFGAADMAHAAVHDLNGNTAGKAEIVVPYAIGNGGPQPYASFEFYVSVAGSYGLVSTAGYDNYTLLYESAFSPANPLGHLVAYNDDYIDYGKSAVSYYLQSNIKYIFVNTAYQGSGAFISTISGPGNVMEAASPVPEPASIALTLAGLGLVVPLARKRKVRGFGVPVPSTD